jgi:Ca2+-transporting ATPase
LPNISSIAVDDIGLSAALAADRLRRDGYNELPSPDRRGIGRIVAEVMRQPMGAAERPA